MANLSERLIFIGLDAADMRIVTRLATDGNHPAFARIISGGVSTPICNPPGLYVGALWPSFFTGSSPAEHGRYCWRQLRPGTYDDEFFQVEQIRGEPVWESLEKLGRRTAVVDMPKAFLNPSYNGTMIKDWGTHDPSRGGLQTSGWLSRTQFTGRYGKDPIGNCDSTPRTPFGFSQFRDDLVARANTRARIFLDILAELHPEVVFCVFSETHCAGHQCWHFHDAGHALHNSLITAQVGNPLIDVYTALDRALTCILNRLSQNDTVIVLASHGMSSHYNGVDCLPELISVIDHGLRGVTHQNINIPHLLSMDARPFREKLRIFPVPNNGAFAALRLNIQGREPAGMLNSTDALALLDHIEPVLNSLYERDTLAPIFTSVVRPRALFRGPMESHLPDLLLEWNREYPIRTIVTPYGEVINSDGDNPRTGDHTAEGMLWTLGNRASMMQESPIEVSQLKECILRVVSTFPRSRK